MVPTDQDNSPAMSPETLEELLGHWLSAPQGAGFWAHEDRRGVSIRVDKPKSAQDATPLYVPVSDTVSYLAVADGLGGSGVSQVRLGDRKIYHAYLASRIVLSLFEHELVPIIERSIVDIPLTAGSGQPLEQGLGELLGQKFHHRLRTVADALRVHGFAVPGLMGGLIKNLPTTFSAARIERLAEGDYRVDTFNCGDSRVYLLESPDRGGIAQLTIDDADWVDGADALTALEQDLRMTRVLSGSEEAPLTHRSFKVDARSILFVCSDGFHHYFPSPYGAELRFLEAMDKLEEVKPDNRMMDLGKHLFDDCHRQIHDDTTMTCRFLGFGAETLLDVFSVSSMRQRIQELEAALSDEGRENYWETNKHRFERFLPMPVSGKEHPDPSSTETESVQFDQPGYRQEATDDPAPSGADEGGSESSAEEVSVRHQSNSGDSP